MDYLLGQILLLPYDFSPRYFALCAGQLIPISQNQALYALLGTKFGGDGRVNFQLPDLRGAEPIPGMAYYIALDGIFPQRQ